MNGVPHSQLAPLPAQLPFRIVSPTIGSGAYACIKKAAPVDKDNPVFAVKFINKHFAQKYGRIKQKQLEMEISLHKHIGMHKNIIEFYDHGDDLAWKWIAMELAEGGDLFDKIEADAGIAEDIAHVYFTQLVSAVGFMHSKGVAHRDLKPENILLSADGDLKLADFGMSTLFEYHGKRKLATTLCGSPPYVAPEVLSCSTQMGTKGSGYAADTADVWSCGIVLFVLLAGNTPWGRPVEGRDEWGRPNEFSEYVESNGRPDDELWNALPIEVLSLLRGMMRINAASRFTLETVRQHPWFTRPNRFMDAEGRLCDPITMATSMFEALRVSFDADPFAGTQRNQQTSLMEIDRNLVSTQPEMPTEDMFFDWEQAPQFSKGSNTKLGRAATGISSTQLLSRPTIVENDPILSQFQPNPSVPVSMTQHARRFQDILPAQSLTRFYSTWRLELLVTHVCEALGRLGVPTPSAPQKSSDHRAWAFKIKTQDGRGCPLNGNVAIGSVDPYNDEVLEVCFVKASGDPLEWRRLFKKVAVLCQEAVLK